MKKSIAIICDDETFDRFWLNENVSCFIKSKIINEKYGNIMFVSENDFDFYVMENIKYLNLKTCLRFYVKNKKEQETSFFLDKYINEFVEVNQNCYDYVIKNDDLEKTVQIIMTIIENEYKLLKK